MQMYIHSVESSYDFNISLRYRANVEIICESLDEIERVNKLGQNGNDRDILCFMKAIDKKKFMYVASQGKSKIIFMLKDNDPEIREIAQGFATFMTSTKE